MMKKKVCVCLSVCVIIIIIIIIDGLFLLTARELKIYKEGKQKSIH